MVEVICGGENLCTYDHPIQVKAISKFSGHALDLLDSESEGEEVIGECIGFVRIRGRLIWLIGRRIIGAQCEDVLEESKSRSGISEKNFRSGDSDSFFEGLVEFFF